MTGLTCLTPPCDRPAVHHLRMTCATHRVDEKFFLCGRCAMLGQLLANRCVTATSHLCVPGCRHPDGRWADAGCVVPTTVLTVDTITHVTAPA